MGALNMNRDSTLAPFRLRKALKIISGITNFDPVIVEKVAFSAEFGGASHIDIAADPKLVTLVKKIAPSVSVCVSAINPEVLIGCVEAGADMVELGNFDNFYDQGRDFSAIDIINMTKETRVLFPEIPLSVTIPHRLSMQEQIELAKELEALKVDVIQTEGKVSVVSGNGNIQGLIEGAAPALAATYALSRAVKIPVMTSSGISEVTVPMALSVGSSGVGVGSAVNKLQSKEEMVLMVKSLARVMGIKTNRTVQKTVTQDLALA
jgi:hypothetical protein